jgi:uncharacterized protein YqgQ
MEEKETTIYEIEKHKLDQLKKKGLITPEDWYKALLILRKKYGLPVV